MRARRDAGRRPAARRAGFGARDLRHRDLRRLHGAGRRGAVVRLPHAGSPGRWSRGHDGRGPRRRRSGPEGLRRRPCVPVRVVHSGLRAHRQGSPGRDAASERARDRRGAGRQPVPLRLLREDRRSGASRRGGARVKLVTYDASGGPRVGVLRGDDVVDAGFDGDMVAFIEAGAPVADGGPVVPRPRLLAPLRPRSLRDFLAFEGHLKGAYQRLGRDIPAEWYEVPAYYKGLPDTVVGPDVEVPWPAYTDQLDHELELAAVIGRRVRDVRREDAAG